jgi:predicted dehydrogenase
MVGLLEFASGAVASIMTSFDVPKHRHPPIEIYGMAGSLLVPDPNRFGGDVAPAKTGGAWETQAPTHANTDGEFRSIGVADMAAGLLTGRPHRASAALALHVLEAMEAFQTSADEARRIKLATTVDRPAMRPAGLVTSRLD